MAKHDVVFNDLGELAQRLGFDLPDAAPAANGVQPEALAEQSPAAPTAPHDVDAIVETWKDPASDAVLVAGDGRAHERPAAPLAETQFVPSADTLTRLLANLDAADADLARAAERDEEARAAVLRELCEHDALVVAQAEAEGAGERARAVRRQAEALLEGAFGDAARATATRVRDVAVRAEAEATAAASVHRDAAAHLAARPGVRRLLEKRHREEADEQARAEAAARTARLGEALDAIRDDLSAGRLAEALTHIEAAAQAHPDAKELTDLRATVERRRSLIERHRLTGVAGAASGATPHTTPETTSGLPGAEDATARLVEAVAREYEALLLRRGAVDFASMLTLPLRLFHRRPEALRRYQDAYRHLLCDEAQDICRAQYALVRQLVGRHRNLTVVGDPCQNLYRWRGADVRFLLDCRRDFPEATVVELDENFRSSGRIVALANPLGAGLPYRRAMRTGNPRGPDVVIHAAPNEATEAAFVAGEVERLIGDGRITGPGEVAVLYRTNRQADELGMAFRVRRLPYEVRGGTDFFARREVRDLLAYLRLAHCPSDGAALARIVNTPPRRLSRVARRLQAHPAGVDELAALAQADGSASVASAAGLAALIAELHARAAQLPPAALLDLVLERSGYRAWLEGQPERGTRLAHLDTLRALAGRAASGLADWLAEVHTDEDTVAHLPAADRVLLTTIHAAKGGEWRVVFVAGAEEGLLPHRRALLEETDARAAVEDELRVAYVAVTRARERLYLSYCRGRRIGRHGPDATPRQPSRFLQRLPPELVLRPQEPDGPPGQRFPDPRPAQYQAQRARQEHRIPNKEVKR